MTQQDLANLKAAYYRGVSKVREGDTWVEYHSMDKLWDAILRAEAELNGSKSQRSTRLVSTGKGY